MALLLCSWRFFLKFEIPDICKNLRLLRFHYTSSTVHIRPCYGVVAFLPRLMASKGASTTLPLRQRISNYSSSALTTMQLRSFYDLSDGAAVMLRLCCSLKPLLCKLAASRGSASIYLQSSNKMYNIIPPVAMINLAIMNY